MPLEQRAGRIGALARGEPYRATLSGTLIHQPATATTTWFLYPGACQDRVNGTWAPKTAIQADSLDSYGTGGLGGYDVLDQSQKEILWHTTDVAHANHATQEPAALAGTSSLWCGKYDPTSVGPFGYPNLTFQILYIDTGNHASNYTLSLLMNHSSEIDFDWLRLVGGGNNDIDPLGNERAKFDNLLRTGSEGASRLRVTWTGSILTSTPGATAINALTDKVAVTGSWSSQPQTVAVSIAMPAGDRALYVVLTSDDLWSNEDGLWPFGHGTVLDQIATSDNGPIYTDTGIASGSDPVLPPGAGQVIQGSYGTPGYIAGRVVPGVGELWQIVDGTFAGTNDFCSLQKNDSADHFFFGVDASTKKAVPGQFNSIVTCAFPIPAGTASVMALWTEYLDLPRGSGYFQQTEYRYFKDGVWSEWMSPYVSGFTVKTWVTDGRELAEATQADSVQLRYSVRCIPALTFDGQTCSQVDYAVLYDDLYLAVVTGVPAPVFSVGGLAQSTFVDGTMTGLNCGAPPCWPGIAGSDLEFGIDDNFNNPYGDRVSLSLQTGLRRNGMGINWRLGYDVVSGGALTNGSYNPAYDQPRAIYRLFDPATQRWSPFDSTALDADAVSIAGNAMGDTTVIGSSYRFDWPPRDKAGLNLPGGFTINGVSAYNRLAFLPRGTRMQYYFKAVDINGGVAYHFSSDNRVREAADLPTLPGGTAVAPDIVEFGVLPGVYATGHAGTLLSGATNTPILNLDGSYSRWRDPVTLALRGLGVRADRYRNIGGVRGNFGGHELTGPPDYERPMVLSAHFPNMTEYAIRESLSTWYRILIQSGPGGGESDARLLEEWWNSATPGTNGGDRCVFVSGDDYFNAIMNTAAADPAPRRHSMGKNVFGINSVNGSWNGTASTLYPTVEDRFAAPGSGPGLVTGYTYPVDGGCPGPNRFDALIKLGTSDARNVAFYPTFSGVTDVAGVAMMSEKDAVTDSDRSKTLGYGFLIEYVRKAGIPTAASNYVQSGVEERMRILYKFLTSCRGPRSGAAADTATCWPCPTDSSMVGNWAVLPGFQTGTYGPLYAIQDNQIATGVEIGTGPFLAPKVNRLDGNYPNPFNPQTTIRFSSATSGQVSIRIFNVGGQLIRTLRVKAHEGANEIRWNGRRDDGIQLASGIYFYRIRFADGTETGSRMALVK